MDFEFSGVTDEFVNLVCCCTYSPRLNETRQFWLHNDKKAKAELRDYLSEFDLLIGYSCVAEARSLISLGLDPLDTEWLDLFLEYRMMTNHNDNLQWGKQLVDGKVKPVKKPKPKWERTEEDIATGFKATHSLAEATYKLTGEIRDTVEKDKMRDLIISAPKAYSEEEKRQILDYCLADVVFLPRILKGIKDEYKRLTGDKDFDTYYKEAKIRGRYSAHTAWMENHGYPIDFEKLKNFSKQVGSIIHDIQVEINSLFPSILPFKWNKKEARYSWDQNITRAWIRKNHDVDRWAKTDSDQISLSLEAFQRFYNYAHDYPRDSFGAQMVRFLKLKQSLYGFSDSGGKRKNFWDSVGADKRVRPYMNHYGAQSSRSQPAASGFMFLKPAWMRALVLPDEGKFMAGIDYGSQEFFVSALESQDQNMIDAYLSGDPYLFTAKIAGAIPENATKETHPRERDLFKATVLGISYLMTKYGLAIKLSQDTGVEWTEDQAQEKIDEFYNSYPDFQEWQRQLQIDYQSGEAIKLACGWIIWTDNENIRSVSNVPIQGNSASIMRKAVDLAVARGLKVLFTLHDAIYIEGDVGNEKQIEVLRDSMRDAFTFYYGGDLKQYSEKIRLDPFAWSRNYKPDSKIVLNSMEVPCSNLYLDKRSLYDFKKFSKFFETPDTDLL